MTPSIEQRAREAVEKFQAFTGFPMPGLFEAIEEALTDQHAEDVAAGEKVRTAAYELRDSLLECQSTTHSVFLKKSKALREYASATQPTQP